VTLDIEANSLPVQNVVDDKKGATTIEYSKIQRVDFDPRATSLG
jgi:hypothetical protein